MVSPIDVKRKGSALVGYWVQYMTLTFDLTHDLDLGCLTVKFQNSSISGIVGLIDVKWKESELIWYWADCMTLPYDHTHDLDLGVSRPESEIGMGRPIDNERRGCESSMILTCVTMVRWADVPDIDQSDFRRRRVVDISSFVEASVCLQVWYLHHRRTLSLSAQPRGFVGGAYKYPSTLLTMQTVPLCGCQL